MATHIQLLTLMPEGRAQSVADSEFLLQIQAAIDIPGVEVLGQYGVLGAFDFVSIVQAPDNETVARFSLEMGVRAGCHVTTLPVIPPWEGSHKL